MENIAAALSDRESGAMEKTALWDDLHVTRGKAEQLEARLRRQAIEDEVLRKRWNTYKKKGILMVGERRLKTVTSCFFPFLITVVHNKQVLTLSNYRLPSLLVGETQPPPKGLELSCWSICLRCACPLIGVGDRGPFC